MTPMEIALEEARRTGAESSLPDTIRPATLEEGAALAALADALNARHVDHFPRHSVFIAPTATLTDVATADAVVVLGADLGEEAPVLELRILEMLRGGLLPVVSFLGPAVAGILTGSFVIETIFQIPGIGREFVNSAFNRDYTLVLGTVILYAVLIMALNLAVDIAQAWMNPKVRLE